MPRNAPEGVTEDKERRHTMHTRQEQIQIIMEKYGATEQEAIFILAYRDADEATQRLVRQHLNMEPAEPANTPHDGGDK